MCVYCFIRIPCFVFIVPNLTWPEANNDASTTIGKLLTFQCGADTLRRARTHSVGRFKDDRLVRSEETITITRLYTLVFAARFFFRCGFQRQFQISFWTIATRVLYTVILLLTALSFVIKNVPFNIAFAIEKIHTYIITRFYTYITLCKLYTRSTRVTCNFSVFSLECQISLNFIVCKIMSNLII